MSHLHEVVQVAARFLAASNSVTFFSTDERCSFFIPSQTTPTAVKHFLFIEWWLIMFCLNDLSQVTTRSSAVSNWLTKCLPSCQSNPQVLRMNATVLPLPIQVLVHAGCSCQCQGRGLARCRPQSASHPRNCESWVVLNELMSSQSWVQLPIMDSWLQASIHWQTSACFAPDRWLVPAVGDSDFFVSVTRTLFIDVKWTDTELVSQLNDTCLGQAPLCLWCLVAHMQACGICMNASTELVCMVCQKVLSRFLRRIAENHRGYKAWCFLLLWTNSLLDAVAS